MPKLRQTTTPIRVGLGLMAAAMLLVGQALTQPVLAQDAFLAGGDGQVTYVNERFGTSLAFPADVFEPEPPPQNGDGRRFTAADAALEVYAWENLDSETAISLKNRLVGSQGYTDVTYSPSGPNWLVLSGFRGDNIFYEKYFFRDDVIHGFGMEFPASAKPRYAPIVESVEDSFKAG